MVIYALCTGEQFQVVEDEFPKMKLINMELLDVVFHQDVIQNNSYLKIYRHLLITRGLQWSHD